jgi:hypothetical protein
MKAEDLVTDIEKMLVSKHGIMLSNDNLSAALGYPSIGAFRKAISRNQAPGFIFNMPNRQGKYALAKDVAVWIIEQRERALTQVK